MFLSLLVSLSLLALGQAAPAQTPGTVVALDCAAPKICAQLLRDTFTKREQDLIAAARAATTPSDPRALTTSILQTRRDRAATALALAERFAATAAGDQLIGLADLYAEGGKLDLAKDAASRGLATTSLAPAERAAALASVITMTLRAEPKGDERNARLEKMVDELDALPAATFEQKWGVHTAMESYYRGDDIDAGIIKHGVWIANAGKLCAPADRSKYGPTVIQAHVNMAEAFAGEGQNQKALDLLQQAQHEWGDVPRADEMIGPTVARYRLVGTEAKAVTAPRWLNATAGQTDLAMAGTVTLLEFTAHWCGPCRESYPGINRLRERFKGQDFRVVMSTRLWGYFGSERNLGADAEIAHDKDYFAEHHLDVPVAIGNKVDVQVVGGKVQYLPGPDPNETAYGVGGIPQIQIIDKHGRIRLIMVGYDDANEEKLAQLIGALISEK